MSSFTKIEGFVSIPSANKNGAVPAVQFGKPVVDSKMGVIVVQEWWGLNQQIQDAAHAIAKKGKFVTIVPDLYRGKMAIDNEQAGHLMNNLDWPGAVDDIRGCAKYLKEKGCTKVGVTGFCVGGALSLASAAMVTEVDAAVPFYGIPTDSLCDISTIKTPLQCHFAAKDAIVGFSAPEDQKKMREKLDKGKVCYEFFSYDAAHAFTNKQNPGFDEKASEESQQRMCDFFHKHLQ